MAERSIVGDLINFRGLVYSPTNENGVIFLFGKVMEDLNMYIEEIKPGFPDCVGRRFTGKGWERVTIEFEYRSSNFNQHDHDPSGCDLTVCWEHDWPKCPVEVLELREIIKSLPNEPIPRPDSQARTGGKTVEAYLNELPEKVRALFLALDSRIKAVSGEIWDKPAPVKPGVSYYSPERLFIHVRLKKSGLRLKIFTRGENIEGVKAIEHERGGAKWGRIWVRSEDDLNKCIPALKKSHDLIKDAIKSNEPTGWSAELEEGPDEETDATAKDA